MTAKELIELKSTLRSDLWADKAAAMLFQQAAEIDSLKKMLVISDDTHKTWLKANSPGGWIDELRKERDALKADAERYKWLKQRLLCADFSYGDPSEACNALVFEIPEDMRVSADLDSSIDAMKGKS